MREHVTTFLLLLVAAFSVAIFISYKGNGTTSPVLTFLIALATTSAPPTPGADLNMDSNAPKTEAPYVTKDQYPFKDLIRVMYNANTTEGFNPRRDVSLPEFNIQLYLPVPVRNPSPPSSKTLLAFFAGGNHGSVRKFLFEQWNRKDQQIQLFEHLPKGLNYTEFMMKSKYCLCPSGYEVASPRITEAIISGCVPVPISDGYVLPFSDGLDWTQFSVPIPVRRIPETKEILSAIPESTYLKLQANVLKVQRHFIINRPARRFDVMHMLLHSIIRRLDVRLTQ